MAIPSVSSTTDAGREPARRRLLKRLSGLVTGSFLAGPLQALLGRSSSVAAAPLTSGQVPYIGEIILAGFNFAPTGYAPCDGRLLPIVQNTALFSILGNTYGGDGLSTFALPDLRGRVPIHAGQGNGLSSYNLGQIAGTESVTLSSAEVPAHTHAVPYSPELGTQSSPANAYPASNAAGQPQYGPAGTGTMQPTASAGDGQAHNNMQPYLAIGYYIALAGVFPPRS